MKNKIQEQVLKEIDIIAKKELRKWLDDGGTIDNFISNKYGEHLEKAISRTIELMEVLCTSCSKPFKEGNIKFCFDCNKKYADSGYEQGKIEQKDNFRKMIVQVLKKEVILIDKKFEKYNKIDNHTIVISSWIADKILAKLNDKEVGE